MKITDTHVFFYTNFMSNWYSTQDIKPQFTDPITKIAFNNTEEAFMWYKSYFFNDTNTCDKIVEHAKAAKHPRDVKALGREVRGYNEEAWSIVRLGFMTYVNLLKYRQNPDLTAKLIETGNRILVEASPVDKVWGVGLSENDPLILDPANWTGLNLLGIALMRVREMIQ